MNLVACGDTFTTAVSQGTDHQWYLQTESYEYA